MFFQRFVSQTTVGLMLLSYACIYVDAKINLLSISRSNMLEAMFQSYIDLLKSQPNDAKIRVMEEKLLEVLIDKLKTNTKNKPDEYWHSRLGRRFALNSI